MNAPCLFRDWKGQGAIASLVRNLFLRLHAFGNQGMRFSRTSICAWGTDGRRRVANGCHAGQLLAVSQGL